MIDEKNAAIRQPASGSRRPKRHQFLVDRPFQLGAAMTTTAFSALILIPVNVLVYFMRRTQSEVLAGGMPEAEAVFSSADLRSTAILAATSLALMGFVFVATILATHRTAGALVAISRTCDAISQGDLTARLTMRTTDNLRLLEGPFNAMVDSIRHRVHDTEVTLNRLAARLDDPGDGSDIATVASEIRKVSAGLSSASRRTTPDADRSADA